MSTDRGFIALYRGFFDHPMFKAEPLTEREAFVWLLMEAEHNGRRVRRGSHVVALSRGELCHSIRFMAKAWKWPSSSRVVRVLKKWENETAIVVKTEHETTHITICNYDKYQGRRNSKQNTNETENGSEADQRQNSNGSAAEQTKPLNHLTTEPLFGQASPAKPMKGKTDRRTAATPLPSSAEIPAAYREYAQSRGLGEAAIARQWARFRNHAEQNDRRCAGDRGWAAAWRNWVDKAIELDPNIVTVATSQGDEYTRISRMLRYSRDNGGAWPWSQEPRDRLDQKLVARWERENPLQATA